MADFNEARFFKMVVRPSPIVRSGAPPGQGGEAFRPRKFMYLHQLRRGDNHLNENMASVNAR